MKYIHCSSTVEQIHDDYVVVRIEPQSDGKTFHLEITSDSFQPFDHDPDIGDEVILELGMDAIKANEIHVAVVRINPWEPDHSEDELSGPELVEKWTNKNPFGLY